MEFNLIRSPSSLRCTISEVSVGGRHLCYVLEDVVRQREGEPVSAWKIKGETAIPTGRYEIVIDMSTRFGKLMPHLLGVEGFEGIRIHPGNSEVDTEGCLLPGTEVGPASNSVLNSRTAYNTWFHLLDATLARGERCFITVE